MSTTSRPGRVRGATRNSQSEFPPDPLWYKDAIIYELHVRAFMDSNGDGIGDFRGLTEKLDYLQDLGVTALWLLPFSPSPLRDDGYDTADYTGVHESYGTLADFKRFLREAHRRGLRVITELVVNHTSDQHPWFQRARRAVPGSVERDFYVWSDHPDRYGEARIIFKDFESSNWSWDPVAKAYFWHRFYAHQPDLNYENPEVVKAVFKTLDFWLDMGVDGLRLDAVPYLFEKEGTNCENLPETHAFLKRLRKHVDEKYEDRMLLAEANQWPEDAVSYLGEGDECHMAFHFPVMPRLFMASRLEQRFPIVEILKQTPEIPANCQWAVFLRNHDELTLEMVTDEERDYMYRVYAGDSQMRINLGIRRRLAPLLGNNRRKIELLNGLLLSMPGTPVLYYGDEIGMGDNVYLGDRNGVRTPMQWSEDRNAGFSRANPQKLYLPVIIDPEFQYEAVNVENQQNNPSSLLWWMKRILGLRKNHKAFGRGSLRFLEPENHKVLAFVRQHEEETLLVVANLSRFSQFVELDLSAYEGWVPVELFGKTRFPRIGELPYLLTLGPHMFHWFALEHQEEKLEDRESLPELQSFAVAGEWSTFLQSKRGGTSDFEKLLPQYVRTQRWFGGKALKTRSVKVLDTIRASRSAVFALIEVEYTDAEPEVYLLPLAYAPEVEGASPPQRNLTLARLKVEGEQGTVEGFLFDASTEVGFQRLLLDLIKQRRRLKGNHGEMVATATRMLRRLVGTGVDGEQPELLGVEQSNTSVRYGDRFILKLFRRLEVGVSQEIELGQLLTQKKPFAYVPPLAGFVEYQRENGQSMSLAILHGYVPNEGDAWNYTLDALGRYLERRRSLPAEKILQEILGSPLDLLDAPASDATLDLIGTYWQSANLLGERTAQMHLHLASNLEDPDFAPEPFTKLYQRSLYQSMRDKVLQTLQLLARRLPNLPEPARSEANALLAKEQVLLQRFEALRERRFRANRIRCHGDYHLGQVLDTGRDFCIIDFEGGPAHSLGERRLKRSPLSDVAGMLRSFHYAACVAVSESLEVSNGVPPATALQRYADFWAAWVSVAYLRGYRSKSAQGDIAPENEQDFKTLLEVYLLEKALYELRYELNSRPDWVWIPLRGIAHLLQVRTDADVST